MYFGNVVATIQAQVFSVACLYIHLRTMLLKEKILAINNGPGFVPDRYTRYMNLMWLALAAIPIMLYGYYILKYAINLPRQDDYDAILGFLVKYKKAPSLGEKIGLLFSQHNEHRIFSSRVVYALYYTFTGRIHFRHIVYIDGAILFATLCVISSFIKNALPTNYGLPIFILSLCMFDMNNFENMNFAMGGMQNFGIVLLFTGSIYYYNKQKRSFLIPAALLQATAIFSSGNGIPAAFFIFVFTLLTRDKVKMAVSLGTFICLSPLYYIGYKSDPIFFTLDGMKFMPFFMEIMGAHFGRYISMVAAAVMLLIFFPLLPMNKNLEAKPGSLPLVVTMVFMIASLAVMAVFRGLLALDMAFSSRYFIYPHIITAIFFAFFLIRFQAQKVVLYTVVPVFLLVMGYVAKRNHDDGMGMLLALRMNTITEDYDYGNKEHAKEVADEACKLGIYCIEEKKKPYK